MQVLLTRPEGQNEALAQTLKRHGLGSLACPLVAFEATETPLPELGQTSTAWIFVSPRAVAFAAAAGFAWTACAPCFAVGRATQQALADLGVTAQVPALETSEGLWHLMQGQSLPTQVCLVRGEGGRTYLSEQFRAAGVLVAHWPVYRRLVPVLDAKKRLKFWREQKISIVVLTSEFTLDVWQDLLKNAQSHWVKQLQLIVPSIRLQGLAQRAGFKQVHVAQGAGDDALLQQIQTLSQDLRQSK
jgi:uroporphyrinogen-III synthase